MNNKIPNKRALPYRIFKWLGISLLMLFALSLLLTLLIAFPPVQDFLSGRAETYLKDKLQTEVSIGGIYWRFPKSVELQEIYLEDQQQDTLAYVGNFRTQLLLIKLLNQEVAIQHVRLEQTRARMITRKTGSNYNFISEAFTADSTQQKEQPDTSASAWKITLPASSIDLQDVDFYMEDQVSGMVVDVNTGALHIATRNSSILDYDFDLPNLSFNNSKIAVQLGESSADAPQSEATSSTEPFDLDLQVGSMDLSDITFTMKSDSLSLQTALIWTVLSWLCGEPICALKATAYNYKEAAMPCKWAVVPRRPTSTLTTWG